MTSRDFCFWLQGYFELNAGPEPPGGAPLSGEQASLIRRHLALVFKHEIDPSMGDAKHQAELDAVHGESPKKTEPWQVGGSGTSGMRPRC